ncbi:MAG TPA: NAD-dependent epimerase/dehydratase family protein [Brevundimonas sp.]|jgi:nucleoside-diphosphate-sugar epimerase
MVLDVVVGAGPVGRETARLLAASGSEVRLVSRTGNAPPAPGISGVSLDGRDASALAEISRGARTIHMCAMAPYTSWPTDFPPIMEGVAGAAERVGARLIVLGNVYGYGQAATSPLKASSPLAPTSVKGEVRTRMWERARNGPAPAIEVRGSDYLGRGAGSLFTLMALPSILAGREVVLPADLDAVHAWTFTGDAARTLVAAAAHEGEWNRAFHVPSHHLSIRDLTARFCDLAGVKRTTLRALTRAELEAQAAADPFMREIAEMAYLFYEPCVLDPSDTERLLGVGRSPLDAIISDTLAGAG